MAFWSRKSELPSSETALAGRATPMPVPDEHFVLGHAIKGPYPEGTEQAVFAAGCFWSVERDFWRTEGVWVTAVGYTAGTTPNPTYQEVCSGQTGHTEAVLVVFDPTVVSYEQLLRVFWEHHNPTQGMRQGNDIGTQYRSGVYTTSDEQQRVAEASRDMYQAELQRAGYGEITTEIIPAGEFYFAEDYHQQYLEKNPGGYCGMGGTGVSCPTGLATG
jgi:peptide-methionine (S)-S-oxide reductase